MPGDDGVDHPGHRRLAGRQHGGQKNQMVHAAFRGDLSYRRAARGVAAQHDRATGCGDRFLDGGEALSQADLSPEAGAAARQVDRNRPYPATRQAVDHAGAAPRPMVIAVHQHHRARHPASSRAA